MNTDTQRPNSAGGAHAALVLEDGTVFRGLSYGASGRTFGEAVFCTGMTGYQETLTDPSYHKQIVVQTAPQIGNTGWNDEDDESDRIWVAGYVVRDPARVPSSWRSRRQLGVELERQGVVGISHVDTRTLTRHLRERGAMRAGVFAGDTLDSPENMSAQVLASPSMAGADLAGEVTTSESYMVPAQRQMHYRVAAIDLGIKANTPRMMSKRGMDVHVLPATAAMEDLLALEPDGVFLSNGPGDPATTTHVTELTQQVLQRRVPLFGICFGNQILGRALGLGTYKMRYGHRGMNIPVIDVATRRVAITAQNHGFALDGEPGARFTSAYGQATISHYCPNDDTVEGVRCVDVPAFSVQYHPEAAAGPHDAAVLFDEFAALMEDAR